MTARMTTIDGVVAALEDRADLGRPVAEQLADALQREVAADGTAAPHWRELAALLAVHPGLAEAACLALTLADSADLLVKEYR